MSANIEGCHLVGSVPLSDTEAVFRACVQGLPSRLKRIPDGETGDRHYFTLCQYYLFKAAPVMMVDFSDNQEAGAKQFTEEQIKEGVEQLKKANIETGYDTAAIESYAVFTKLREEGVIPPGVKFQVGLPTIASVIGPFVEKAFQPKAAPIYEAALFRAMRKIQDKIPHEDLSIQLDLAVDTAYWEGEYLTPWFENTKGTVMDYLLRMINEIDQDVELGVHNCYGDMEHKHWFEPTSMKAVVERGSLLFDRSSHPIKFFHAPVPVSVMDNLDFYLEPLKDLVPKLEQYNAELYLGVVQYDDLEGTKKRIEAASKVVPRFGIATECGWGRTPADQIEDIMSISSELSKPLV
ncbi:hypothetical protein HII31_11811 [Pseudocercospora fuligena]|uniref:Uncharacterized protein n=1 Tax=Pseudocercospora fuligena TaxID=685502 RepID=A0A8H6R941_9PEZI|nr:hypothetical protein HII31_11811 [Pseudocercospora fuligena]